MSVKIQKWGNSQGLRLPKHILEEAKIEVGDEVEIIVGAQEIHVKKKARPKFDLADMVARMPVDYSVKEESFGKPVGEEEW